MVDVEDELWKNVMSWWAGIPLTGHVGQVCWSSEVFRFESDCGHSPTDCTYDDDADYYDYDACCKYTLSVTGWRVPTS